MFGIPPLQGSELIEVLLRLGCRVRERSGGVTVVERGSGVVFIPDRVALGRHVVAAIVRTIGFETDALVVALADRQGALVSVTR